mmetsp:Transcript_87866/g.175767  ORF Transcript_87866/g.175767 Transcript_87866/m.175767 type:complete len:134 (+) Transcript_87866:72-473(+)|eukprot:CAMPEP_0171630104 /NCGR_PEP_ID=MMETSP0990-20121206/22667_1 /TAXON_ID=483369 /ORGANISM="non described non described, Strain CCMP2098" /LENGTH=133 /DNA_ID=CAMNT_0012199083 /DNA_START=72 /DNA_END=473 /DNA_ORIENTATION=+
MSWFRGKASAPPAEKTDTAGFESTDDQTFGSQDFNDSSNSPASFAAGSSPKVNQLNQAAVEQLVQQEQARQAQMQFLSKLTEMAFDKCVTKPDSTMSSRESECIAAYMHKYVDAQKLIIGRYQRQAAGQSSLN